MRFATSIRQFLFAVSTCALLGVSIANAAGINESFFGSSSIVASWHVEGFPSVRMFGTFGSALESAIREDAEAMIPHAFVEERRPSWLRPQLQPMPLVGDVSGTPNRLFLEQNYPNPFNPSTMIRYGVPHGTRVKLSVHTLLGSQIRTLVDQWQEPGTYSFDFIAAELPSGAYFYRLQTDNGTITRRMIISK